MSLIAGTKLGPYEILATIGAGGMGEVYKARDTKLNRHVALKVLPAEFAGDTDRLVRLRREAQVLASLNHPNIAAIHGFEDSAGVHALVMEFVEGRDLSEIAGGHHAPTALNIDDALPIARQIAVALEAAHDQGIVHRDLKPANIKLTADGTVKVLDFGLAKALADAGRESHGGGSAVATVTSPALTQMGVILGTAGYMAPEQAKGKPVDRRADIWAFGVVLFELLAGAPVYRGETVTDTIAQVITQPAPWGALPATTPVPIRRLLRRCLEKDPRNRYQSAGDIRVEIDEFLAAPADAVPAVAAAHVPRWRRALPWALVAMLAIALLVALWPAARQPAQAIRLDARLGSGEEMIVDANTDGAMSVLAPDGSALVYAANAAGVRHLFYRPLDRLESTVIAGTDGAVSHFLSPDGRSIGFFAGGTLKKIPLTGGATLSLATVQDARGGTWGADGTIVYTPWISSGLWRVPAIGGTPVELTHLEAKERTHRWPWFLPDGRTVLFVCQLVDGSYDDGTIEAVRVDTGARKVLVRGGTFPRYTASGHLIYTRQGTLFAVPFDPQRLETTGDPREVLAGIMSGGGAVGGAVGNGASQISVADNGTLAYLPGTLVRPISRLVFVDRHGKQFSSHPEPREFRGPRFSPNGQQVALQVTDGQSDNVYVLDRIRGVLTRMTFDVTASGFPIWSPDGKHLAYFSDRSGKGEEIYRIRADGAGEPEQLTTVGGARAPGSYSHDGKSIVGMEQSSGKTGMDLFVVSLEDRQIRPVLNSPASELMPALSPDGKWLAYMSDESPPGPEIFVRAFPGGGARRQVSSGGGGVPFWTKEGRELVFLTLAGNLTGVMAVDVTVQGETLQLGKPQELFKAPLAVMPNGVSYGVSDDGNQFALLIPEPGSAVPPATSVTLILNFFDEIRRALGTR